MENSVKEKIENLINESEVMLFMKGTPEMPQCGFSAAVVGVLNHLGVNYKTSNVLQDEEIREGIKEYSDWPTIPQLYVKKRICWRMWYNQRNAWKWRASKFFWRKKY